MLDEVFDFATLMSNEILANSVKGDWREWKDIFDINNDLIHHQKKLNTAIINLDKEKIKEHLADCANHYLFLANAFGLINVDNINKIKSSDSIRN